MRQFALQAVDDPDRSQDLRTPACTVLSAPHWGELVIVTPTNYGLTSGTNTRRQQTYRHGAASLGHV